MDDGNRKCEIENRRRVRQFKHICYYGGMRLMLRGDACEIRRPIRSNDENVVVDSKVLAIAAADVDTY